MTFVLLAFAPPLWAKVHYVNKGVKYHIGDDRYNKSEDSNMMDAYPVVGQEWIQGFTVSEADTVRVHIDQIWGVDDCPYCLVLVSIGKHDMGRLTQENNHSPFNTLTPLAFNAQPGVTYYVKVASYGKGGQVDDLTFEGLSVETEGADVTFLPGPVIKMPDEPMPTPMPDTRGPCEGTKKLEAWVPSDFKSQGWMPLGSESPRGDSKNSPASLSAGDYVQLYIKIEKVASGDRVSQDLEISLGSGPSGWVLGFHPGQDDPGHGNLKIDGRYSAPAFRFDSWKKGDWNDVRVARCLDGKSRLFLNGRELGQLLDLPATPLALGFNAHGLVARVSEKPF